MSNKKPPPVEFRFKPNVCPNPSGRPKGSKNKMPKMRKPALDENVRFPVDGKLRTMTRSEAIMRFATQYAFRQQDQEMMSLLLKWNVKLCREEEKVNYNDRSSLWMEGPSWWELENIEAIVRKLGLGKLIYPNHTAQRVALNPEVVTLALSQFGDKRLTRAEQKLVLSFTLNPKAVDWPEWWEPDLRTRKCRVPERFFREDKLEWKLALINPDL
jgi:hypothetical protein